MSESNDSPLSAAAPTRRQMMIGSAVALSGVMVAQLPAWGIGEEGISNSCKAIHQEVLFKANRQRVYDALTNAAQFNKVIQLSAAAKSGAALDKPAEIGHQPGAPLVLFGGYITGQQIELVPNQRINQVWRAASWPAGIYSIARFELAEQGAQTKLIFDHTGFPVDQAEHLAIGWKINYWEPLAKYLAQGSE